MKHPRTKNRPTHSFNLGLASTSTINWLTQTQSVTTIRERAACNSRFAKAGVSCFYESEVLNSSFVLLMKFSAKNPRLRKAAKRYLQP